MSKETTIQQLKALQRQIEEQKKNLKPLLEAGLAELFEKHPTVKTLEVGVNNHEFNDGEPTYFSLRYNDMTVHFYDGIELSSYDARELPQHEAARDEFVKFFDEFDVDGFYEEVFGDAYESLTFEVKRGKVVTS